MYQETYVRIRAKSFLQSVMWIFAGLPALIVAVFYVVTYAVYEYGTDLASDQIYWDVNNYKDMWAKTFHLTSSYFDFKIF